MGNPLPGEQVGDGLDDAGFSSAALTSDELAELSRPSLVSLNSIQLPTYESKGDALSSVESERLGQLSPGFREGCRSAQPDAGRWFGTPNQTLRICVGDVDVFLSETTQHIVHSRPMRGRILIRLPLHPPDPLLQLSG